VQICDWEKNGQAVERRYRELALRKDYEALEALRLIQDRYQKLVIPPERRCSLGQAALAHLGSPISPRQSQVLYVAIYEAKIELISPAYRDAKLIAGHSLLDDLP
jgi:hypothetical protein